MESSANREDLFNRLYEEYRYLVIEIALGIIKDKGLAEDAFQMTFFSVAKNIEKITDISERTKKYIVKIARNSAIDIYRKNQKTKKYEIIISEESEFDEYNAMKSVYLSKESSSEPFEEVLIRKFDRIKLIESLEQLDEKHKVFLREYYYDELSMKQIAQKHGISEEAAKKRVHRSVNKLQKIFLKKGASAL